MTIRRVPADFRVREALRDGVLSNASTGAFAVYELTKESLTTPEAVATLARALGVPAGDCSYAGLKDKHALTTQHVAVRARSTPFPARAADVRWSATPVGFADSPLSARDIARNEFEITVRNLTRAACDEMNARAARLSANGSLTIINYFGDQRFGSARHGQGFAASNLVRGEFEHALRLLIATPHRKDTGAQRGFTRTLAAAWGAGAQWGRLATDLPRCPQRRAVELLAARAGNRAATEHDFRDAFATLPYMLQEMCVDAWQSWLWNAIIRRTLPALTHDPMLTTHDDFGDLAFLTARDAHPLRATRLALPSPDATYHAPLADAARAVLHDAGITLADLRIPGLRRPAFPHANRDVVVNATNFSMQSPIPDDLAPPRGIGAPPRFKRTLTFSLPSGSYATVVLRALGQ